MKTALTASLAYTIPNFRFCSVLFLLAVACLLPAPVGCFGQETDKALELAAIKIDQLVEADLARNNLVPNPPADPAILLRRTYLDTVGRIPTVEEIADFQSTPIANQHQRLIAKLLESDGHRSHMFNWLADMLRVRDSHSRVGPMFTYQTWLKQQLKSNRPWDELVHDLMTATGSIGDTGPAGYLLRDAGMPLDSLSNTLTTFLGANVACAQCHDHPFASWSQQEFYEMAAFFGTTRFELDDSRKPARSIARLTTKFSKANLVGLLQPNISRVVPEKDKWLKYPKDYEYDEELIDKKVDPYFIEWVDSENLQPDVKTADPDSLRTQFADWLVSPKNPRFATAIANRTWKRFFGVAVHEPIQDLDDKKLATNPELMAYLSELMIELDFDLRRFQQVLLLTKTYQRASSAAPKAGVKFRFPGPLLRRMSAEQVWDSAVILQQGAKVESVITDHATKMERLVMPKDIPLDRKSLNEKEYADRVIEFAESLSSDKKTGSSSGRSMFLSVKKRRGQNTWLRASELQQPASPEHLLRIAGQSDRSVADDGSTEGGITESLALMNGDLVKSLIQDDSDLMKKASQSSSEKQIQHLYLAFHGRKPNRRETKLISSAMSKGMPLADVAWSLLNSREFIFIQ